MYKFIFVLSCLFIFLVLFCWYFLLLFNIFCFFNTCFRCKDRVAVFVFFCLAMILFYFFKFRVLPSYLNYIYIFLLLFWFCIVFLILNYSLWLRLLVPICSLIIQCYVFLTYCLRSPYDYCIYFWKHFSCACWTEFNFSYVDF